MALTVTAAFNEFQRNIVNLDNVQTDRAKASRNWLLDRMNSFTSNDNYFPIIYPDIHTGFGSFARHTKIRPLDDIDLMFGLDGDDCVYIENLDKITITTREGTHRLKYYKHDGTDLINSRKIINCIISKLNEIPQYDKADIKRNQEAATLKLKSYEWNFDIVPAFITTPDFLGKTYYLIPDGNGHWKKTDPRIDKQKVTDLNVKLSGNMLNVIRVIKYWQKRPTMPSMSSYLLETMLLNYFNSRTECYKWVDFEIVNVLGYLASAVFYPVYDHKGIQGDINNLSDDDKLKISTRCYLDKNRAEDGRLYETQNNYRASINKWREVFGDNFPSYG
ncbi:TPA: nucleotidyltransferase [Salmonella enterica]|nr:nucleotidyltransferase [Salmonella enterica subsp. enterica serovar Baguida]